MRRHEHKSAKGCCICRCKSSTSRFAKSLVWEKYFEECFLLKNNDRKGDICNACVLVVKRFCKQKKKRVFDYVVDSRCGPGSKSMIKIKKQRALQQQILTESNNDRNSYYEDEVSQSLRSLGNKLSKISISHIRRIRRKQGKDKIMKRHYNTSLIHIIRRLNNKSNSSITSSKSNNNYNNNYNNNNNNNNYNNNNNNKVSSNIGSNSKDLDDLWKRIYRQNIELSAKCRRDVKVYKMCCGIFIHSLKTGDVHCVPGQYKTCPIHQHPHQLTTTTTVLSSTPSHHPSLESSSISSPSHLQLPLSPVPSSSSYVTNSDDVTAMNDDVTTASDDVDSWVGDDNDYEIGVRALLKLPRLSFSQCV